MRDFKNSEFKLKLKVLVTVHNKMKFMMLMEFKYNLVANRPNTFDHIYVCYIFKHSAIFKQLFVALFLDCRS